MNNTPIIKNTSVDPITRDAMLSTAIDYAKYYSRFVESKLTRAITEIEGELPAPEEIAKHGEVILFTKCLQMEGGGDIANRYAKSHRRESKTQSKKDAKKASLMLAFVVLLLIPPSSML